MKYRPRNYGRNFRKNFEMECIVKSALSGPTEYRATGLAYKQFLTNSAFSAFICVQALEKQCN